MPMNHSRRPRRRATHPDPANWHLIVTSAHGTTKLDAHLLTRAEAISTADRFNEDPTDSWEWEAVPVEERTPHAD